MGEVRTGDVNVGCEDGDRLGGDADTGGGLVDGGGWEWGVPGTQPCGIQKGGSVERKPRRAGR